MKACVSLGVVFVILQTPPWSAACELDPQKNQAVAAVIEKLKQESGAPGISIAIGVENALAHSQAFGLADVENDVPVTPSTRFRTASIAKSMTAVCVLSLAERELLNLDTDVRHYVPEFAEKRWPVTSRQLLGHLGGVRHYKSAAEAASTQHFYALDDALQTFARDPLLHQPGTKFRYTTFGYNLLGSVAEHAGRQSPKR